jgi:predicted aspartyl protease
MATGQVSPAGMPVVQIEVAGHRLEAVVDTGFEGGLQLPNAWRNRLNPRPYRQVTYQLGGGQTLVEVTYLVAMTLDGHHQTVETLFAPSDEILLGVDALRDYRLTVDFPAGTVAVDRATP